MGTRRASDSSSAVKILILATSIPQALSLAFLLTAFALRSLFFLFGGRAPHPEGTWPKTLLHKPMGVASTEGGGLARRPSSEIDRLAAKGRGISVFGQSGPEDSTSKYGRALRWLAACGHQEYRNIASSHESRI